jgi:hypothetical protein
MGDRNADMIPESVYKAFVKTGTAWAEAHALAAQLEDGLKPLLAQITIEAKGLENCSMAEAKDIALSTNSYRDAIVEAIQARKEANICKVKYDSTRALFDAQRTVEATHRAAAGAAT